MREVPANTAIQQRGSHKQLPPTQLTPMETQLVTTVSTYPQASARDTTAGLPNSSTHEPLTAGGSHCPPVHFQHAQEVTLFSLDVVCAFMFLF